MRNIGDVTFHEAYRRTGVILNIPVSPGRYCCPARRRARPSPQSQHHPDLEARRDIVWGEGATKRVVWMLHRFAAWDALIDTL